MMRVAAAFIVLFLSLSYLPAQNDHLPEVEIGTRGNVAELLLLSGEDYYQKGDYGEALKSYADALQFATQNGLDSLRLHILLNISGLYGETGDFQKAYDVRTQRNHIKDSLRMLREQDEIVMLKEKYEIDKKDQELALLTIQAELAETERQRSGLFVFLMLLIFLGVIVTPVLMWKRVRIKRRIESLAIRNQIADDLHDDIGSALSSIDINSRIAIMQKDDAATLKKQLGKIQMQADATMDNMRNIIWAVKPEHDTLKDTIAYMQEFATTICDPLDIYLDIQTPDDLELSVDSETRRNLFLVFKEALNNAVKYSDCTKITIRFGLTDKKEFYLIISDNGIGFVREVIKEGNGLTSMQKRADKMGKDFRIESEEGNGTKVIIGNPPRLGF